MKRELKFKAWDTVKKIFVPQGEITFSDYGDHGIEVNPNCLEYVGDPCNNGEPQRSRFIIIQYTGRQDKNGVDIYEGDIVKVEGVGVCGEVEYNNDCCSYVIDSNNMYHALACWNKPCLEVIGNIFESDFDSN